MYTVLDLSKRNHICHVTQPVIHSSYVYCIQRWKDKQQANSSKMGRWQHRVGTQQHSSSSNRDEGFLNETTLFSFIGIHGESAVRQLTIACWIASTWLSTTLAAIALFDASFRSLWRVLFLYLLAILSVVLGLIFTWPSAANWLYVSSIAAYFKIKLCISFRFAALSEIAGSLSSTSTVATATLSFVTVSLATLLVGVLSGSSSFFSFGVNDSSFIGLASRRAVDEDSNCSLFPFR